MTPTALAVGRFAATAADHAVEVQVVAGMRSGHHAIIHWLLCHFPGVTAFRNNPLGDEHWLYRHADDAYQAADRRRPQPKDCYLFNLEDVTLRRAAEILRARREALAWGRAGTVHRLLVLRDLDNFMASRVRAEGGRIPGFPAADWTGLWLSHARAFAGLVAPHVEGLVFVSYNAWAADRDYRRRLAARLGLRFTDEGRGHVPRIGAGSSFDGTDYDGRGDEMAVFDRWRSLRDHPHWRFLVADEEARALSTAMFGPPGEPRPAATLDFDAPRVTHRR